jgi:hypothetical protein
MRLYLIRRQERPEYHKAPYHRVIICTQKRLAQWEIGTTDDHAWAWERLSSGTSGGGWLLVVWNGFPVDYGHVVHGMTMPDGAHAAFWRDYEDWPEGVRDLLPGAVWWSHRKMPAWLAERGVIYPPDQFTRQDILDHVADDGFSGSTNRPEPDFWPPISEEE